MSRKTRIIISITGIILIVSILIGVTYGFYVTKIYGNENSKSISITSGESSVLFTDLSSEDENVIIAPDTSTTKLFKVQNTGNVKATYSIFLVNVQNNFVRTEDVRYILYRIGNTQEFPENYTGCVENPSNKNACSIVVSDTEYPTTDSLVIGNEVIETPNDYYTYALVTTYINQPNINQDADQGHTYGGKIKIYATDDKNTVNPYEGNTTLLAYNIIENAINNKNGTILVEPEELGIKDNTTKPAEAASLENEKILSKTLDDHGTSYYYRGNVIDNYVNFAGMCWRIVRIEGDGSIKLILEDQDQPCSTSINGNWAIPTTTGGSTYTGNFGYTQYLSNTLTASDGTKNSSIKYLMNYLHGESNSDKSMATAFKNFQSTFTETELSKLKSGNWCLGDNAYDSSNNLLNLTQIMDNKIKGTSFNYDSYQRLGGNNGYQSTLKCNGTIMNDWDDDETNPTSMYVGAITADEVAYAGGKVGTGNQNYYLINEEFKKGSSGANKAYYFWSLSPYSFNGHGDYAFYLSRGGSMYYDDVNDDLAFRPSVSLASSAVITGGEGTLESPYLIG